MRRPAAVLASAQELRRHTAPALLLARARARPDAVAFRAKSRGLYQETTWAQYALQVARAAKGLQALGLARGDRIAIMADACAAWLIADLAAQSTPLCCQKRRSSPSTIAATSAGDTPSSGVHSNRRTRMSMRS